MAQTERILCGIGNYFIWWFTAITGGLLFCILALFYCIGAAFYIFGNVLYYIVMAPIPDKHITIYDIENDIPAWADKILKKIWGYMRSRPLGTKRRE